jgi:hypothetical protein
MPPQSPSNLSMRSPVCVSRWDEFSNGSSVEYPSKKKDRSIPLVSKSISFADQNQVFEIMHLNDFPPDAIADIWYDSSEYAQIKNDYRLTIFLIESGEKFTGEEHTSRGLEYRTREGAWARYENKRDAYNAVLDEQDRQWKEDIHDWDIISRVYLEHSSKRLNAAYERGVEDEKEVIECSRLPPPEEEKKKKTKMSTKSEKETNRERRMTEKGVRARTNIYSSQRTDVRSLRWRRRRK